MVVMPVVSACSIGRQRRESSRAREPRSVRRSVGDRDRHARTGHGADDPQLAAGRRPLGATALGVAGGQAVWTTATSLGLAALIVASEPVFVALKLVGAAYLVYLGAQSLLAAAQRRHRTHRSAGSAQPRIAFRQSALSNLGNPKIAVFFSGLCPSSAARSASCSPSNSCFAA